MSESKKKPSWAEVFEALDKAPLRDDFLSPADRDNSLPQVREDWEPEYDDEPRIDGKSSLDLFRESCEATDATKPRKRETDDHGEEF
ncbi:MAG TPA: hypothetical protein VN673_16535 [Clostridia bacterium]|nr:hypothetical protein [Clostridia bacterium]